MTELSPLINSRSPALRSALSTIKGLDAAREALETAKTALRARKPVTGEQLTGALIDEATAALTAGQDVPDDFAQRALAAQRCNEENVAAGGVLQAVIARLEAARDQHLAGDLSPAFADLHRQLTDVLTDVPALAAKLRGIDTPGEAIESDVGAEWKAAQQLLARYRDVRTAQRALYRHGVRAVQGTVRLDAFDMLRNVLAVFPDWRVWHEAGFYLDSATRARVTINPPWPADLDSWQYLTWLVTSEAEPWVPAPEEAAALREQAARNPAADVGPGLREHPERESHLVDPTEPRRAKAGRVLTI